MHCQFRYFRHKNSRLQNPCKRLFYVGCGGWIWTNDLRVMSPTSYRAAPLRDIFVYLLTRLLNYYSIINSTCQPLFQKKSWFFYFRQKSTNLRVFQVYIPNADQNYKTLCGILYWILKRKCKNQAKPAAAQNRFIWLLRRFFYTLIKKKN